MGIFNDNTTDKYAKAAEAVRTGNADKIQREMNERASKRVGSIGDAARKAYK